jgi:16S rRNA (uracil1498-N3)-methyltransferase
VIRSRIHVPPERLAAGPLVLEGDDHHYLFRVRRLARGDEVLLFDGAGREATARVDQVTPERAHLTVDAPRAQPAAAALLRVLLPLLKGERMDWAIEKLTELGVAEIVPVRAARCVVTLAPDRAAARVARWEALARAAARQSGRAALPRIGAPCELPAALADPGLGLVLWEQARGAALRDALPAERPARVTVLVGPEGGLAAEEVDLAVAAGFVAVGLGDHIVRAETAAIAAAAIVAHLI